MLKLLKTMPLLRSLQLNEVLSNPRLDSIDMLGRSTEYSVSLPHLSQLQLGNEPPDCMAILEHISFGPAVSITLSLNYTTTIEVYRFSSVLDPVASAIRTVTVLACTR